jgi:hypothetical protein
MNREARYEDAFLPGETIRESFGLAKWKVVRYDIPEPGVHFISEAAFPQDIVIVAQGVSNTSIGLVPKWVVKQIEREHA